MEFRFDLSNIFGEDVSLVDRTLTPYNDDRTTLRTYRGQLSEVIDALGKASAEAQGLHGPITSASKLSQSEHIVYLKVDRQRNNAVVGFLKVGTKKLFIFDHHGNHHEVEPLCVLDFYVHESCQRRGAGRQIFDYMLQREGIKPCELAIDRPSPKLISFMSRHYSLESSIPQVNKFVVFDSFFGGTSGSRSNSSGIRRRRPAPVVRPPRQSTNKQFGMTMLGLDGNSNNANNIENSHALTAFQPTGQLSEGRESWQVCGGGGFGGWQGGGVEEQQGSGYGGECQQGGSLPRLGLGINSVDSYPRGDSASLGRNNANTRDSRRMGAYQAMYSRYYNDSPTSSKQPSSSIRATGHDNFFTDQLQTKSRVSLDSLLSPANTSPTLPPSLSNPSRTIPPPSRSTPPPSRPIDLQPRAENTGSRIFGSTTKLNNNSTTSYLDNNSSTGCLDRSSGATSYLNNNTQSYINNNARRYQKTSLW